MKNKLKNLRFDHFEIYPFEGVQEKCQTYDITTDFNCKLSKK